MVERTSYIGVNTRINRVAHELRKILCQFISGLLLSHFRNIPLLFFQGFPEKIYRILANLYVFQCLQHIIGIDQGFLIILEHLSSFIAEAVDIKEAHYAKQQYDNKKEDQPQG